MEDMTIKVPKLSQSGGTRREKPVQQSHFGLNIQRQGGCGVCLCATE